MASPFPSLLEAASSHPRRYGVEDQLTEVFATVLEANDDLARGLFVAAGLPAGERFVVRTQVEVVKGSRPDMLVDSFRRDNAHVSRLWCEHKVDSTYLPRQRERYAEALRNRPGESGASRLIVITHHVADAADRPGDWIGFTWQEIGELVERVGRAWAKRGWREEALQPDAPAKWRLAYELLWYLEEKGLATVHAFNAANLAAYELLNDTEAALMALLERSAQQSRSLEVLEQDSDSLSHWVQFKLPSGWLEELGDEIVSIEILAANRDYWSADRLTEPALGVGLSFSASLHEDLSVKTGWIEQLGAAGFSFALWEDWVRVYRTRPLRDLLEAGDSFGNQAALIRDWTDEGVEALRHLDPGPLA